MNPFDLPGPAFLAFYAAYCAGVLASPAGCGANQAIHRQSTRRTRTLLAYLRAAGAIRWRSRCSRSLTTPARGAGRRNAHAKAGALAIARRPVEQGNPGPLRVGAVRKLDLQGPGTRANGGGLRRPLRRLELMPPPRPLPDACVVSIAARLSWPVGGQVKLPRLSARALERRVPAHADNRGDGPGRGRRPSSPDGPRRRLLKYLQVLFDGVKQRRSTIVPGGALELPLLAAVFACRPCPTRGSPTSRSCSPRGHPDRNRRLELRLLRQRLRRRCGGGCGGCGS